MTDEESSLRNVNASGKQSASKRDSGNPNFSSQTRRCCNCKQSKCIKLYCECYAAGVYCNPACNCNDCWNNPNFEDHRKAAIQTTLEKNPSAFQPKISTPNFNEVKKAELLNYGKHSKGCACKKSGCMKKYCECFQAGIPCSDLCKCSDCHNTKEYYELNKKKGGIDLIKQDDVPDNNSFFCTIKFLLASNDSDPGTSKHLIPNKKIGNMSQEFLEKLYKRLHAITEMNVEDYLRRNENPQDLKNFFKEKSSTNKRVSQGSNPGNQRSSDDQGQIQTEEKITKHENEELMCDEKVDELKPEIVKEAENEHESGGQIKTEEADFIGSDDQKYSFYDIKQKLILREFISVLRNLE